VKVVADRSRATVGSRFGRAWATGFGGQAAGGIALGVVVVDFGTDFRCGSSFAELFQQPLALSHWILPVEPAHSFAECLRQVRLAVGVVTAGERFQFALLFGLMFDVYGFQRGRDQAGGQGQTPLGDAVEQKFEWA